MTLMFVVLLVGLGVAAALFFSSKRPLVLPVPKRSALEVCNHCGQARTLLDEELDDVHLNDEQRRQEQSGAVDYHVWWCGYCEDGVVTRNAQFVQTVGVCRACSGRAEQSMKTVVPATATRGGELQVELACQGCGHLQRFWRYTPRVTLAK
ncbi:hypothetical protein [Myxococcus eversor]|uniref:hypothetical protein n=1 Tax=Myxococcus eversor TaxID=2709661 RepID=UPI0013D584CA|nr:hypothetical protein [Myxococcus eversor]